MFHQLFTSPLFNLWLQIVLLGENAGCFEHLPWCRLLERLLLSTDSLSLERECQRGYRIVHNVSTLEVPREYTVEKLGGLVMYVDVFFY